MPAPRPPHIQRDFDDIRFLGAATVPPEYAWDPDGYLDLVCGPTLDAVAPLVRWIGVARTPISTARSCGGCLPPGMCRTGWSVSDEDVGARRPRGSRHPDQTIHRQIEGADVADISGCSAIRSAGTGEHQPWKNDGPQST